MSSILPPTETIWWKTPVDRSEGLWVAIALIWCLFMFAMMPIWHIYGNQNLSNEAYKTTPEKFQAKVDAMVAAHEVRRETAWNVPVVKPPVGSDVYMLGKKWQWYPALELKKDESYRLHLSSIDWQHGFSVQPINVNTQVLPGYESVITITPNQTGEFTIICNEYCGVGHHFMTSKIYVTE